MLHCSIYISGSSRRSETPDYSFIVRRKTRSCLNSMQLYTVHTTQYTISPPACPIGHWQPFGRCGLGQPSLGAQLYIRFHNYDVGVCTRTWKLRIISFKVHGLQSVEPQLQRQYHTLATLLLTSWPKLLLINKLNSTVEQSSSNFDMTNHKTMTHMNMDTLGIVRSISSLATGCIVNIRCFCEAYT